MRYKVGIIGFGYWGPKLLRNFMAHEGFDVRWVCDRHDDNRTQALSIMPSSVRGTADAEEVLSDPDVDVIVIASQAATHASLVHKAIENGKHVFVEKPFSLSSIEAEPLSRMAREKKRHIFVDHTLLFSPSYLKLREELRAETYGKIKRIYSRRCDFGRFQKDANIIWHLMYHDAYLLNDLLQTDPCSIQCRGTSMVVPDVEDGACALLSYSDGLQATVICDMCFPEKTRDFVVLCEHGMLVWDEANKAPLRAGERYACLEKTGGQIRYTDMKPLQEIPVEQKETLANVVDAFYRFLGGGASVPCDAEGALKAMWLVEQINLRMQES